MLSSNKKSIKPAQAKTFLDNLVADSITYKNIFDTDTRKWEKNELPLKNSLKTLYGFNVTQQTPMVLSIMCEFNSGKLKYKYAKEALESIEHFHYILTAITSQRSSGGIASMYSTYGRQLSLATDDSSRSNIIKKLKQKMKDKIVTYDEFIASLKTLKFTSEYTKQKRIIQYTLTKFDSHYNTNGVSINYDLMTLEHILAQNPSKKAINHDNSVGQIGNLILIDEQTNNKLGNKAFTDKKQILTNANIYIDPIITSATNWTSSEIEARTNNIATKAFNK